MADILDRIFVASGPQVIFEKFGDEMVIANLDSGYFYSVEGSGGDIWSALVAGCTGREFAAAAKADGDGAAEIERFIGGLITEGLLTETARSGAPSPGAVAAFTSPSMQKFDDLQGLLLVDPIHEASPAGWPFVPAPEEQSG